MALSREFVKELSSVFRSDKGREMTKDDMEDYLIQLGWSVEDAKSDVAAYSNDKTER